VNLLDIIASFLKKTGFPLASSPKNEYIRLRKSQGHQTIEKQACFTDEDINNIRIGIS